MSKAKGGGKGKGKGKGGDEDQEMMEKVNRLDCELKSLQERFIAKQELTHEFKGAENEVRAKRIQMEKYLSLEKNNIVSVMLNLFLNFSGDMTRQYKQMQEELIEEIDYYKEKSVEKDQILALTEEKIQDLDTLTREFDYNLKKKDDEINELKRKIDEISNEFSKMLKDTLEKMQERIEMAQWDIETDPQMMKKLKEMAGMSNQ